MLLGFALLDLLSESPLHSAYFSLDLYSSQNDLFNPITFNFSIVIEPEMICRSLSKKAALKHRDLLKTHPLPLITHPHYPNTSGGVSVFLPFVTAVHPATAKLLWQRIKICRLLRN